MAQDARRIMDLPRQAKIAHHEVLQSSLTRTVMSNRIDYSKVSPEGYKAFGGVYVTLQNSELAKQLVDLVYLRVSQINGCAFCIDMHSRDLLKSGLTVDKLVLVAVWRDAGQVFSVRERAALAWAETVTRVAETGVPDADYEAAAAEFSGEELADLTYAIGLMNAFNRFGIAFRSLPAAAKA
jgi:AhpD family alkylhydroperoxidase